MHPRSGLTRTLASRRRHVVAAMVGVAALIALAVAPVVSAAAPVGTITVIDGATGVEEIVDGEPLVCTFAVIVDLDVTQVVPVVGWKIKDWVPGNWKDGTTRLSGQGTTDAAGVLRIPVDGFLSLPDGHYNVVVDDEWPIDGSSLVQSFRVRCAAQPTPTPSASATPTASPAPTPTPSATPEATATERPTPTPAPTPTPLPTGSVAPTPTPTPTPIPTATVAPTPTPTPTPTPLPTGSGAPTPTPTPTATATPNRTLPPTDTLSGGGGPSGRDLALIAAILVIVVNGVLIVTPRRQGQRR